MMVCQLKRKICLHQDTLKYVIKHVGIQIYRFTQKSFFFKYRCNETHWRPDTFDLLKKVSIFF
jgi:hypothetical protein